MKCNRILLMLILATSIQTGEAESAQNLLWKSGTTFDFGTVRQKRIVSHRFEFVNQGADTIRIGKVRSSCGCTAAMVSATLVAPGAEGAIDIKFNTSGRKGAQHKTITVEMPSHAAQEVTLAITGNILVPYPVEPEYIRFGECVSGRRDTVSVTVQNTTAKAIQLGQPQVSDAHVAVRLSKNDLNPGEKAVVTAIISPDSTMAPRFIGTVTIPLVAAEEALLHIPLLVSSKP